MPHNTLSIGGATYDLFLTPENDLVRTYEDAKGFLLASGAKQRIQSRESCAGGGGCNTAISFAKLGCNAHYCGVLAADAWGTFLQENFQKHGVSLHCSTVVEDEESSFSLILSAPGRDRSILYHPGVNMHLCDAVFCKECAKKADLLYLSSLQEGACQITDDILEAKKVLAWNPGGVHIRKGIHDPECKTLLASTTLLFLNAKEALQCTGESEKNDQIRVLHEYGVRIVCITDGKNGAIASSGDEAYTCTASAPAYVHDTTGAGDAFGSAFAWGYMQNYTLKDMLRAGTLNAISVLGKTGAQTGLLTESDIQTDTHPALTIEEVPH